MAESRCSALGQCRQRRGGYGYHRGCWWEKLMDEDMHILKVIQDSPSCLERPLLFL